MDSGIQVIRCAAMASSTHTSDPMEKAMLTAYQQANLREDVEMTMVKEYPISEKLLATTRLFTTIERRIHGYSKGLQKLSLNVWAGWGRKITCS